jgi:hypothetical protein
MKLQWTFVRLHLNLAKVLHQAQIVVELLQVVPLTVLHGAQRLNTHEQISVGLGPCLSISFGLTRKSLNWSSSIVSSNSSRSKLLAASHSSSGSHTGMQILAVVSMFVDSL